MYRNHLRIYSYTSIPRENQTNQITHTPNTQNYMNFDIPIKKTRTTNKQKLKTQNTTTTKKLEASSEN